MKGNVLNNFLLSAKVRNLHTFAFKLFPKAPDGDVLMYSRVFDTQPCNFINTSDNTSVYKMKGRFKEICKCVRKN